MNDVLGKMYSTLSGGSMRQEVQMNNSRANGELSRRTVNFLSHKRRGIPTVLTKAGLNVIFFLAISLMSVAGAQVTDTAPVFMISGTVSDKQTGKPIPDVNIVIAGSRMGSVSMENGNYFIQRIPHGTYEVQVDVIGYQRERKRIFLDRNTKIDFRLTARPVPFNPVLVTATRSHHLQSEVTVCSEVITREQWIEKTGNTVAEILEGTGNLFVKDNGGIAGIKTLSVRGSSDAQVLVLLDGQRLNTAQSGGVDLNTIPMEALERIEIVRGGHSALMGTDAMGGTLQLITRNPKPGKKTAFGLNHTEGSFGSSASSAYGSLWIGPFQSFMVVNRFRSDGNFAFTPPDESVRRVRENNDVHGSTALFKSRLDFRTLGTFQLMVQALGSDRGTADPVLFPSTNGRRNESRHLANTGWQKQLSPRLQVFAQARFLSEENRFKSLYENDRHRYRSFGTEANIRWAVNPLVLIQSGMEWNEDRLNSTKFQDQNRKTQSMYAEVEMTRRFRALGQSVEWKWIPAIRADRFSDRGFEASPMAGMLFRSGRNRILTLRGNIGKSYRVPTFNDLYWPELIWPGYGGTRGNSNLKPETGLNADLGLSFQKIEPFVFQAECSFFRNRMEDLILWQSDADFVFAPVNVGRATIQGLETLIAFHSPNDRFHITLAPSWMQAVDGSLQNRNKRLIYRPDWKIDADVGFHGSFWGATAQYQYVGKRFTSVDNTKALPDYFIWNANLVFSRKSGPVLASARLQIINVLDASVYSLAGYPLPGREYRFSVDISY